MKILSLGWGVQSFTLASMVALGELEPIDYAVHADTTHERTSTYKHAEKYTGWLEDRGVKVITLKTSNAELTDKWGGVMIPAHSENRGMIHRQCTGDWKITEIRRWLQVNRNKQPVEQWLGISMDEYQRMKPTNVKYITNRWPLIEKKMTRADCVKWLTSHDLDIPTKSACVFCPFQSANEWREIKNCDVDWEKAIDADKQIRNVMLPGRLYIHQSQKPLEEVDMRTAEEKGQMTLWDSECYGICGV